MPGGRATKRLPSLGLGLGLGLAALAVGCAEPVIVDPRPDGGYGTDGGSSNGDGGPTLTTVWSANPAATADFYSEATIGQEFRQWKRDPYYYKDSATQYLFFAGSSYQIEEWQIGYFKQDSGTISNSSQAKAVIRKRVGSWDGKDLFAPAVRYNAAGSPRWTLYYAANGDPTRPDYVSQIGSATSADGSVWDQTSSAPLIPAGTFSGATTTSTRADAYGATDPWVLVDGANVVMYYAGLSCSGPCKYQILRSVSTDGGKTFPPGDVVWSGRSSNAEEAGGVAGPSVIIRNNQFVMAYTAVKLVPEQTRAGIRKSLTTGSIGIAVSNDGIHFSSATANDAPLIGRSASSYRSNGAGAPSVYVDGANVGAYFGAVTEASGDSYFHIARADLFESKVQ